MTSKQVAAALGIHESTLSRFLSGERLPEWQILLKLHELVEHRTGEALPEDVCGKSRDLMYAAARSRGGLQGRKLELEVAAEDMKQQETRTQQLISELREELESERSHRENVEKQCAQLQQQNHQDRARAAQDLRELTKERDVALERIALLEDKLRETEAMLDLQQGDREMLGQRAKATEKEIQEIDKRARFRGVPSPEEDPTKVLCPLCNTYTGANLRWCVRCLGEVSTSTPVGTRSPNDPPEPPVGFLHDPLATTPPHDMPSDNKTDHYLPTVEELLERIKQDRQRAQAKIDGFSTLTDVPPEDRYFRPSRQQSKEAVTDESSDDDYWANITFNKPKFPGQGG